MKNNKLLVLAVILVFTVLFSIPAFAMAEEVAAEKDPLLQAAENGDARAQVDYGKQLLKAGDANGSEALTWFEAAYNSNGEYAGEAANQIGWLYDNDNNGIATDYEKANEWFEKSAALDYPEAITHVGMHYASGKGYEKNEYKALEMYDKALASAKDYGDQRYTYWQKGILLANTNNKIYDLDQAIDCYVQASARGIKVCSWELARIYDSDTRRNSPLSVIWYKDYLAGNETEHRSEALWRCGYVMAYHLDMKDEGLSYLRQSAEADDPNGMFYYAETYNYFNGNSDSTIEWYQKIVDGNLGEEHAYIVEKSQEKLEEFANKPTAE